MKNVNRGGFTLLELMMALMILSIMLLLSFFSFDAVVQSWNAGMEISDAMGQADYVMEQVVSGLRSAYYPDTGVQPDEYGFQFIDGGEGEDARDTISWVKIGRAMVGEECGFAESPHRVDLTLSDAGDPEMQGLVMKAWRVDLQLDDFDPEEDVEYMVLSPRVVGFNCRMLDKDQPIKDDEPNWQDEWSFSNTIPKAVEVTLYMAPVKKREDPLEVKRIVEIPMFELSQNPRQQGGGDQRRRSGSGTTPGGTVDRGPGAAGGRVPPGQQGGRQPGQAPGGGGVAPGPGGGVAPGGGVGPGGGMGPGGRGGLPPMMPSGIVMGGALWGRRRRRVRVRRGGGEGGSALIIALWTITLLSILVMSFALDAMIEGKVSNYVRQRRRVDYLTQSGVAIAEMLLAKQQNVSVGTSRDDDEDRWKQPALRIKRGQTSVIEEPIGDGMVRVEIIPESSRWNLNMLVGTEYDQVWEKIFMTAGIPQEYYSGLIDCWNDWVDADSLPLRDGAEDDYYKSLEPPYTARNGPVDTVSELQYVKGFVPAIMDGGVLNPEESNPEFQIFIKGIRELFTTYGDGKINVNAAPMEVLMTVPGIDDLVAGAIVEEREGGGAGRRIGGGGSTPVQQVTANTFGSSNSVAGVDDDEEDYSFKSDGDFMSRIPGLDSDVARYISVRSGTFRVVIEGRAGGISHRIDAIAEYDGNMVRYLRWREDP